MNIKWQHGRPKSVGVHHGAYRGVAFSLFVWPHNGNRVECLGWALHRVGQGSLRRALATLPELLRQFKDRVDTMIAEAGVP